MQKCEQKFPSIELPPDTSIGFDGAVTHSLTFDSSPRDFRVIVNRTNVYQLHNVGGTDYGSPDECICNINLAVVGNVNPCFFRRSSIQLQVVHLPTKRILCETPNINDLLYTPIDKHGLEYWGSGSDVTNLLSVTYSKSSQLMWINVIWSMEMECITGVRFRGNLSETRCMCKNTSPNKSV